MSSRLDAMIDATRARDASSAWSAAREVRVREGALCLRDARARRDRVLRRGLVVAGGAGLLVLALLRVASSAPADASAGRDPSSAAPAPSAEVVASRALSHAGYARD
jgi:hypothetical protein